MISSLQSSIEVSIHAPARGATAEHSIIHHLPGVSIHAPARGATLPIPAPLSPLTVSIHAPARGATRLRLCQRRSSRVSIHAPARGATIVFRLFYAFLGFFYVSIRAPARGATTLKRWASLIRWFQSTLPHGERRAPCAQGRRRALFQSTLPHGERRSAPGQLRSGESFNPRSRTGSDALCYDLGATYFDVSIHAPARGATP